MNRRHPHTFRFYRRRMIRFARRLLVVLAFLALGIVGGIENGTIGIGQGALSLLCICPVAWWAALCGGVIR